MLDPKEKFFQQALNRIQITSLYIPLKLIDPQQPAAQSIGKRRKFDTDENMCLKR